MMGIRIRYPKLFLLLMSALVLVLCLYMRTYGSNEVVVRSSLDTRRLTEQHGIDCSAVYNMDPVALGKSLALRKRGVTMASDASVANATSDCARYLASRGYGEAHVSEAERDFPLAYSLVVHKDAAMVERILRAVYMPHNVYCLHYDLKSPAVFAEAMRGLARCLPKLTVASQLEHVQYAGISRLHADLNCLKDLANSPVPWRYAINLCGQDFPLRSNSELVRELRALGGASMLETVRPSNAKKQRFSVRYILRDKNAQYHPLPVRTAEAKAPPPHGIQVFVGSAYFTLAREFVTFVQQSRLAKDFLAWSEDTYSPDEHFWASLIRVPEAPGAVGLSEPDISDLTSKTRVVKWEYLEHRLYPACTGVHLRSVCIYGAAELRWLLDGRHWFANKLDPKVDPILIECLEEKLAERQRTSGAH
ncbi:beta-1,3-galactosyl-O-glycosyl-glycoprotein beta-1,6-N-acetylglucosaminyltransferase 4-like isoform X3 [Electrophorus electricus]|nr:beta-1,3-galactosyl-O-glycosyl-glycoprotein beta-1,6-N-acetylglucosaminyltransferase 4-like isoform X2 [Electrophorus electricus]XP_035377329.1 beta-1,3-galactosyl-O-glycosyl-glycoprotein beta-1,6-N-acetylglucosaminyltransferase 4-like isoform X3 [Electrophorus electricus]